MSFVRYIISLIAALLFSAWGTSIAIALPQTVTDLASTQAQTAYPSQAEHIGFTARAPPTTAVDVAVTGDTTVMHGGAFVTHAVETQWASINFSADLVAPNRGFGRGAFVEVPRQNIGARADDFTGGVYQTVRTTKETVVYRAFGGEARLQGGYATPNQGATRADLAIEPDWGNTMQFEATVTVPSGTTLNVGTARPQATLQGGGDQILMPRGWDGIPVNNNTVRITDTSTGRVIPPKFRGARK